MIEKKIDKKFKDSIGNLRREPSEKVWAGIEAALDKTSFPIAKQNEKKHFVIWYFSGAAVLVAILFLAYLKSCEINTYAKDNTPKTHSFQTSALSESKLKTIESNTTVNIPSEQKRIKNKEIQPQNNIIASKNNFSKLNQKSIVVNISEKSSFSNTKTVQSNTVEAKVKVNNATTKLDNNIVNSSNTLQLSEKQISSNETFATKVVSNSSSEFEVNSAEISLQELTTELNSKAEMTVFEAEESNEISSPNSPQSKNSIKHATGFSLDILGGPNYVKSNNQATFDFESPLILSKPVSSIMQPQINIGLKYHFDNFYFTSGIGYSIIGENIKYSISKIMHDTSDGYLTYVTGISFDTIGYFDDPNFPGISFPILSASIDTISSVWNSVDKLYNVKYDLKTNNRYKFIDIPLVIGYQYTYKRFTLDVSTGLSISYKIGMEGTTIKNNNNLAITGSNDPYNNSFVNYLFMAGVGYQLNNKFSLIAKPSYRTNLTSMFKDQINGNAKYHSFGFNIGLNYKL